MSDTTIETSYGMDLLWASHKDYACKILVFHKAKNRTSMYFHKNTDKTWFCNAGKFKLRYVDVKDGRMYEAELEEGKVFNVPPLMPVQLEALVDNSSITEASNGYDEYDIYHVIPADKWEQNEKITDKNTI